MQSPKTTTIVWFRKDLRITDHAPLLAAIAEGNALLCLYIYEKQEMSAYLQGFEKNSPARVRFLYETLQDLHASLRHYGQGLKVLAGDPLQVFSELISNFNINKIFSHITLGEEEDRISGKLKHFFSASNIIWEEYAGSTLFFLDDLPYKVQNIPDRLKEFRSSVASYTLIRKPLGIPETMPLPPENCNYPDVIWIEECEKLKQTPVESAWILGGEVHARHLLSEFINLVMENPQTIECKDYLDINTWSSLKAYVSIGSLSVRYMYACLKKFESNKYLKPILQTYYDRLVTRDYFWFLHNKYGEQFYQASGMVGYHVAWMTNLDDFQQWQKGKTGYPIVDALMRQLTTVGYLSNKGRMVLASFLIKNLGIDWRWGAAWFEYHLLDFDASSNAGNWQTIAGLGVDNQNYRYVNIPQQGALLDPDGDFIRKWLPELTSISVPKLYAPEKLTNTEQQRTGFKPGLDYPMPMVDFDDSIQVSKVMYKKGLIASNVRQRNSLIRKFVK